METGPTRIPLTRKTVPHSYSRNRRLEIGSRTGSTNNGIPTTNNFHQPAPSDRILSQDVSSSTVSSPISMMGQSTGAVYTADVRIGTEWYNLIVDTGSTDTWVSCYVYDVTRCLDQCPRAAISITYGSGAVCVSAEYLPIKVGKIQKQDYGVGIALNPIVKPGTEETGGILLGQSQGILGLGYPALATFESPVGYLSSFVKSFSVYLAPKDDAYGSFLILDGVDDDVIAKNGLVPYRLPIKKMSHWTVGLTGFHVDGYHDTIVPCEPLDKGSCDAIIDTGTTMLVVPPKVFNTLVTKIFVPAGCYESQQPGNEGVYICGRAVKLPRLQFTFGKMNFYLEMEDYIQRSVSGTIFAVEIQPTGSLGSLAQSWVLGGTLLKKFYSSYEVSSAVVLYCVEGTTCDQNGATTKLVEDSVLGSNLTENGSTASEASAPTVTSPSGSVVVDSANSTASVTALPSDKSSNASTIVSPTKSGGGNSHAVTITVIASVAGIVFVALVVFLVRKLYRKRQHRQQESLVGLEMETIASSGAVESTYASGAALTPTAAAKR